MNLKYRISQTLVLSILLTMAGGALQTALAFEPNDGLESDVWVQKLGSDGTQITYVPLGPFAGVYFSKPGQDQRRVVPQDVRPIAFSVIAQTKGLSAAERALNVTSPVDRNSPYTLLESNELFGVFISQNLDLYLINNDGQVSFTQIPHHSNYESTDIQIYTAYILKFNDKVQTQQFAILTKDGSIIWIVVESNSEVRTRQIKADPHSIVTCGWNVGDFSSEPLLHVRKAGGQIDAYTFENSAKLELRRPMGIFPVHQSPPLHASKGNEWTFTPDSVSQFIKNISPKPLAASSSAQAESKTLTLSSAPSESVTIAPTHPKPVEVELPKVTEAKELAIKNFDRHLLEIQKQIKQLEETGQGSSPFANSLRAFAQRGPGYLNIRVSEISNYQTSLRAIQNFAHSNPGAIVEVTYDVDIVDQLNTRKQQEISLFLQNAMKTQFTKDLGGAQIYLASVNGKIEHFGVFGSNDTCAVILNREATQ